ncbi:hypothetical protein F4821DRAFT_281503 [Hypoxylon rubiginosum]|uniref:Uncharacterized protein n=1 Tax=Hypoxylon rubiginosum TaxID=110542 RepID=A0ACC0CQT0_9PEZI|nr:hypothetical protein F4821DRAFT_281503 [Hypoxylon rubiginosum]
MKAIHGFLGLLSPLFLAQAINTKDSVNPSISPLSWLISDFEWRTGAFEYTLSVGAGPAPGPPLNPPTWYVCGASMVRMNITSSDGRDLTVACIEQTSDAKLANITDMSRYNAGPSGTPPASPHWFVCGGSQLFIYPTGKGDAWGVKPPEPEWQVIDGYNVSTKMRLDPVEKVLSIAQTLYCDDGPADCVEFNATGSARLPELDCRGRTVLEPDANVTVNSPIMGPSVPLSLFDGSVCSGPDFRVVASV